MDAFVRISLIDNIRELFDVTDIACDLGVSYNIAPTQPIAVIQEESGTRRMVTLRWGLIAS